MHLTGAHNKSRMTSSMGQRSLWALVLFWSSDGSNSWPEIPVSPQVFFEILATLSLLSNPARNAINPFLLTCQKWLMRRFQNSDHQDNNNRWNFELLGCFPILVNDLEFAWVVRALLTTKLYQVNFWQPFSHLFEFWPFECSVALVIYDFQMRKWHGIFLGVNNFILLVTLVLLCLLGIGAKRKYD